MKIKIALCQMYVSKYPEENRETIVEYMQQAADAGADFFVPPEMWSCSFDTKSMMANKEEPGGPSYQLLKEGAKKHGMYIVGGSIPIINGERINNSCFVFDRQGNEIANYNKIHMFDLVTEDGVDIRESKGTAPGDHTSTFDTEFGTCGVALCYDLRFDGLFMKLAKEGAKLIFLPAEFKHETGKKHWSTLVKARALDTQTFFAAVCSPFRDDLKAPAYGHSMVVDPWGEVVTEMDEKPGMTICEIDLDRVEQVRKRLPVLEHQRPDLY